jgi:hypothetical protein
MRPMVKTATGATLGPPMAETAVGRGRIAALDGPLRIPVTGSGGHR